MRVQVLPFQCRMSEPPTAHTSFGPLPQTLERLFVVALETLDHARPFQCRAVPASPTAHTSFGPLPQTPERLFVVQLETLDHARPFQCTMAPAPPTAQTSLGPLPQTPESLFPWGKGFRQSQSSATQTTAAMAVKFWPVTFPPFTVTAMLAGVK